MKWIRRILIVLLVAFIGIQFVRADRTNPPVDESKVLRAPAHVQPILDRACNDCHSSNTRWPWYTNVAPISWWIADHVHEGREHLSFSEFGNYSPKDAAHLMDELCDEVKKGHMPMPDYLRLHPEARLSDTDKRTLCDWADAEERRFKDARRGGGEDRAR